MNIRHAFIFAAAAAGIGLVVYLNIPDPEWWDREHPLANPIQVVSVEGGRLYLADGRTVEPAGVVRQPDATPEEFDAFLRVVVAQGVEVVRDLGDGRAFLNAEPKFWNWCGTCRRQRHNWAGSYFQVPLSEYLIYTDYANAATDQLGLTPREKWRLDGVLVVLFGRERPTFRDGMISYDAIGRSFESYEEMLAWEVRPPRDTPR